MAVELINSSILKHCSSSTDQLISNTSTDVKVPLTLFDKAAFDLHVAVLYAFRPPMPSNEAMKEGLSKALIHFPHLAGRHSVNEQGQLCIHLNNAGVRIIETNVPTTLPEQLPFTPSQTMIHLFPPIEGVQELFQIQLNRYACGGLVIGQTAHHHVADGQAMSSFFKAWAHLVRGLDIDVLPYHDRAAVTVPRNPPIVEFDHRNIEFQKHNVPSIDTAEKPSCSIENLVVSFSTDFIAKLKLKVTNENSEHNQKFSTFECLLAHLWKKVTHARGLEPEECTQVRVAVNGRSRIKPQVPMEFFGNLVLWAYPKLRVQEVLHENYTYIAREIHEAVARVDNKYFQSFIDFGETSKGDGQEPLVTTASDIGNSLCPNMEVDSWLRFEFHELDFGGGIPVAFLPPNLPVEGLVIFVPSFKEKGGVDVFMALLHEHVHLFKQNCHTLD